MSLKERNDSASAGVQGSPNEREREIDGMSTCFCATMLGVVYNVTCAHPDNAYDL